jgi:predicted bacteriocin transport accessory protein
MKNNIIKWGVVAIAVLAIIGVISSGFILRAKQKELDKHLIELNMSELKEKIENKDTFILVITQTTCSHCMDFKPKIENVANKYKLTIYYIETNLLSKEETTNFKKYISYTGTPTTVFILNGKETTVANRLNGSVEEQKIIDKLKSNGFID